MNIIIKTTLNQKASITGLADEMANCVTGYLHCARVLRGVTEIRQIQEWTRRLMWWDARIAVTGALILENAIEKVNVE